MTKLNKIDSLHLKDSTSFPMDGEPSELSLQNSIGYPGTLLLTVEEPGQSAGVFLDAESLGTLLDTVIEALGGFDTASSNSRQFYIETGRYMTVAEVEAWSGK